jgi:hypothetical protein
VLRWPGNALHFLFLVVVVLLCGLIYGIARLGIALFVWGPRRGPAVGTLRGWMLKQAMSTLGATFIKLGQVMSTRPDLFAPEVIEQLRSLQDRIPPFAYRKVKRVIEEDFGKSLTALFTELDEKPVAAASVAQVHRARLRGSGHEVAVKVLRPGVRRQVERDQVILIWFARAAIRSVTRATSSTRSTIKPTLRSKPRTTIASTRTSRTRRACASRPSTRSCARVAC